MVGLSFVAVGGGIVNCGCNGGYIVCGDVIWVINNSTLLYYELSKLIVKTYRSHGLYCVCRYID